MAALQAYFEQRAADINSGLRVNCNDESIAQAFRRPGGNTAALNQHGATTRRRSQSQLKHDAQSPGPNWPRLSRVCARRRL